MPIANTTDLALYYEELSNNSPGAVLLLHGWPDDASTWDGISPAIEAIGRRVIVPTLRGFGETRFIDPQAPRTGNSAIHAMDMIALLDALGAEKLAVVGRDWGSKDASIEWPAADSPSRTIATTRLPAQAACSAARRTYHDELMTFSPAHALAAHRPLGSVMRARLQVYRALSAFRQHENGIVASDARRIDQVPA